MALAMAAGCAGELAHPERFADPAACVPGYVEQLFITRCASCHAKDKPVAGLDLESSGMATRLVEMPSAHEGPCAGRSMIALDGKHLLSEKLGAATCGAKMPVGGSLSREDLACVDRWIEGAIGGAR